MKLMQLIQRGAGSGMRRREQLYGKKNRFEHRGSKREDWMKSGRGQEETSRAERVLREKKKRRDRNRRTENTERR